MSRQLRGVVNLFCRAVRQDANERRQAGCDARPHEEKILVNDCRAVAVLGRRNGRIRSIRISRRRRLVVWVGVRMRTMIVYVLALGIPAWRKRSEMRVGMDHLRNEQHKGHEPYSVNMPKPSHHQEARYWKEGLLSTGLKILRANESAFLHGIQPFRVRSCPPGIRF